MEEDDVVLGFSCLLWVLWYSFFKPRSSLHRLEHLGALGENKYGSLAKLKSPSLLRQDFGISGDRTSSDATGNTAGLSCSGISFPSEKSSSAGSITAGSSRRNSKSPAGKDSRSGFFSGGLAAEEDLETFESSRLKEIRGLSQPKEE